MEDLIIDAPKGEDRRTLFDVRILDNKCHNNDGTSAYCEDCCNSIACRRLANRIYKAIEKVKDKELIEKI